MNAYEPYVIKTRKNDLNRINEKNIHKVEEKHKEKAIVINVPEHYDMLGDKL